MTRTEKIGIAIALIVAAFMFCQRSNGGEKVWVKQCNNGVCQWVEVDLPYVTQGTPKAKPMPTTGPSVPVAAPPVETCVRFPLAHRFVCVVRNRPRFCR